MKRLNALIPFEVLCDVDLGLVKMVLYEYSKKGFNTNYLNLHDETLKYLIMTREEKNPLFIIENGEFDRDTYDQLYQQFIEKEYSNILHYTPPTNVYNMINTIYNTDFKKEMIFTIWCNNKYQKQLIDKLNSYFHRFNILEASNINEIDFSDFDVIYIKYLDECIPIKNNLISKNLYVSNYGFNVTQLDNQEQVIKLEYGKELLGLCILKIVDVYNIDEEYIPVG